MSKQSAIAVPTVRQMLPAGTAAREVPSWPPIVSAFLPIAVLNSLAPNAIEAVSREGWLAAAEQTFGVSMIVVAATAAGTLLASRAAPRPVDAWDWSVLAAAAVLLAVPIGAASLVALVLLALHLGWRDRHSTEALAAASLFGGLGVMQLLIGPFLQLFASHLLTLDAVMVANALAMVEPGATHAGNLVDNPGGQSLIVDAECASIAPVLQTILAWLTIVRLFRPAWRRSDVAVLPFIVLPVVAANVLRMGAMALSREDYELVHGPTGVYVITIVCILVAVAAARWTLAHEPSSTPGR